MSFHIVLFEPDIPQNTGNIIRLCANTGSTLHLIKPLGFSLNEKQLKRAGLDYHDLINIKIHDDFDSFLASEHPARVIAIETVGTTCYSNIAYKPNDFLLFGKETTGITEKILRALPKENIAAIPMKPNNRSINLSNSVALVLYEAWRQQNFK